MFQSVVSFEKKGAAINRSLENKILEPNDIYPVLSESNRDLISFIAAINPGDRSENRRRNRVSIGRRHWQDRAGHKIQRARRRCRLVAIERQDRCNPDSLAELEIERPR